LSYFESRLKLNFNDLNDIKKKFIMCEKLGIKNLILEPKNNIINIPLELKIEIGKLTEINLFYRINLKPDNLKNFKKIIKNFNNFKEILSVESEKKDVQIYAATDSRIDIISFSDQNIIKTITPGVLSLIKQNNKLIEFSLAPIMVDNKATQSKNLRNLYRFLRVAKHSKVNYIINGNFEDIFDFRNPRSLISICYSLLEIPLNEAKNAFYKNITTLLEKINRKYNHDLIEPDVKLILGEKSDA